QGHEIAARPFRVPNCSTRPLALADTGPFCAFGTFRGGVAMLPVRLDHWRATGRLAKLGRGKATEQARGQMAGDGGKPGTGSAAGPGTASYADMVARPQALIP